MPDWKKVVEERLAGLNLSPEDKEDIVAELAAHLEDFSAAGPETTEPDNRALAEVPWHKLLRAIERAKRKEVAMNRLTKALLLSIAVLFPAGLILLFMGRAAVGQVIIWIACAAMLLCAAVSESNHLGRRTRTALLPGLATFFGTSMSLLVCEFFGMHPQMIWMGPAATGHNALMLYWPWIASLPLFGATGACLSQRAHGTLPARLAAGLSPALIMLTVMALLLPFGLAIDGLHFFQLVAFGLALINWVAIPAAALLLGALPFLRESNLAEIQAR